MERFTIHGARGSMPACGSAFARYGGETTCFSLETDQGLVIIDSGTGIAPLGRELVARPQMPPMTLLFTHFHMDHVMGFPFFRPLFQPGSDVRLLGDASREGNWQEELATYVGPPFCPIDLRNLPANLVLENLPGDPQLMVAGVRVTWRRVTHPQSCLAYRLDAPGLSVAVATDHEPGVTEVDDALADFCRDADILISDAQYLPDEYEAHRGWGHGTWRDAVALAQRAEVSELVLTHHDPERTDDEMDAMVARAREAFSSTVAARESLFWQAAPQRL